MSSVALSKIFNKTIWYKDGIWLNETTSDRYEIQDLKYSTDSGDYMCKVVTKYGLEIPSSSTYSVKIKRKLNFYY